MYKTLYNISVRRDAEEQEPTVKAVLEKCKRSDVQEDESLLTRMEKEVLQGLGREAEKTVDSRDEGRGDCIHS